MALKYPTPTQQKIDFPIYNLKSKEMIKIWTVRITEKSTIPPKDKSGALYSKTPKVSQWLLASLNVNWLYCLQKNFGEVFYKQLKN